ncbi:MAG: thiolase family protein [Janthinobacterium lividum]
MSSDRIAIVAAKRTPIGSFQGELRDFTAPELGGFALKAACADIDLSSEEVEEVFMGCVLQAGVGQNPARQAAYHAGLSQAIGATTINKVCGSGMKSLMLAHDLIKAGSRQVVAAGGMESMSNAPYILPKARSGYRFGHQQVLDALLIDGLEDAYQKGCAMGMFAENTAERLAFSRESQDQYAIQTTQKAMTALESGKFKKEVTTVAGKISEISQDETPFKVKIDKISNLKAAFRKEGTVTAASSSSLSDGAAALILMSETEALRRNLPIRAYITAHATHSQEPEWFTMAPIGAIEKLLDKIQWTKDQVDLYEINEAFAVVTMAAIQGLKLDPAKVNIHGGACALGHPIGASGARIVVTLLHALESYQLRRGVASLCIGGGEATAIAIERPD